MHTCMSGAGRRCVCGWGGGGEEEEEAAWDSLPVSLSFWTSVPCFRFQMQTLSSAAVMAHLPDRVAPEASMPTRRAEWSCV